MWKCAAQLSPAVQLPLAAQGLQLQLATSSFSAQQQQQNEVMQQENEVMQAHVKKEISVAMLALCEVRTNERKPHLYLHPLQ